MFSSESWLSNQQAGFYNGVARQSLRFDDGSSAYLSRTPSSAGNRKTFTLSYWVKRGNLTGTHQHLFYAVGQTEVRFNNDNTMMFRQGASNFGQTTMLFRDVSAWYHCIYSIDTTQATESNRIKLYVNGEQVTISTFPSQNTDFFWNSNVEHQIGASAGAERFDGYMAEVNFVDGSALDPTSFGETKNGVWIPKAYSGSYGTNGFRLQFNQTGTGTASSITIGADTSGNANHFTSSGIVASDCDMPDSPENNFCTINPLDRYTASPTFSEGNLKVVTSSAERQPYYGSFSLTSGKWYWEVRGVTNTATGIAMLGISGSYTDSNEPTGNEQYDYAYRADNGNIYNNASDTSYGNTYTDGDIIGVALDLDNNKLYFSKNGTFQNSGDPSAGTNGHSITDPSSTQKGGYSPALSDFWVAGTITSSWNFGADSTFQGAITAGGNSDANSKGDFKYAVPSGYLALCSSNLPEPTISPNADTQADDYFNTVLNTGDGGAGSFTGVGFQPDFVWAKNRTNAYYHELWDVIRGVNSTLFSNDTLAEDTTANRLVSFDSDGFSYGTQSNLYVNSTNSVAWCWKAGGTAVSNTDGTITSSVSANTDAGFSIVTYTGNGTGGATVGHALNTKLDMVIVKGRTGFSGNTNWRVYHSANTSEPATEILRLNSTDATSDSNVYWNDTEPTSSVFSLGTHVSVNENNATFVAYCFHSVEGYSRFGSYIGNGSTDGTFVYTGFRPAWVMVKRSDGVVSWNVADSTRSPENLVDEQVQPNLSNAENLFFDNDFLSNGFKVRTTDSSKNASGGTYIYMAFAENPFKYANAR